MHFDDLMNRLGVAVVTSCTDGEGWFGRKTKIKLNSTLVKIQVEFKVKVELGNKLIFANLTQRLPGVQ